MRNLRQMLNAPPEPETVENKDDVTLPEQNNDEDIEQYLNSEDNNHESSNLKVEEVCIDSSAEIDEPPSKKPRVDSTEEPLPRRPELILLCKSI